MYTRIAMVFFMVVLLNGCSVNGITKGYEGEVADETHLARIVPWEAKYPALLLGSEYINIYIEMVGDKVVGSFYKGWAKEVFVKEGRQRITLRYMDSGGSALNDMGLIGGIVSDQQGKKDRVVIEFMAEKGRSYQVQSDAKEKRGTDEGISIWVEDAETKKVVGGNF